MENIGKIETEIEILKRKHIDSELFAKATLDAVSAHICVLDKTGIIVAVNQAWKDFYDRNHPKEKHPDYSIGVNYLGICHTATGPFSEEALEMADGITRVMNGECDEFTLEYPCHSETEKRWFQARVTRFHGHSKNTVIAHETITERKLADEKIQNLLNEKKELDHHVKNDMNTIFNLLWIQANAQKNINAKSVLLDAASYIKSMIVLYDKLYHTDAENILSIKEYFTSLIKEILQIFPQGENVRLKMQIDEVSFKPKKLSTIALILNELITNAMKYAFADFKDAEISVDIYQIENTVTILFEDNGITIPESISIGDSPGFGLRLVDLLVKQINGIILMERKNGTKFILEFEV
jgi:two-component sensor histidine kinase